MRAFFSLSLSRKDDTCIAHVFVHKNSRAAEKKNASRRTRLRQSRLSLFPPAKKPPPSISDKWPRKSVTEFRHAECDVRRGCVLFPGAFINSRDASSRWRHSAATLWVGKRKNRRRFQDRRRGFVEGPISRHKRVFPRSRIIYFQLEDKRFRELQAVTRSRQRGEVIARTIT